MGIKVPKRPAAVHPEAATSRVEIQTLRPPEDVLEGDDAVAHQV